MKFHLHAAADLAQRYARVFRHSWRERKKLDPIPRQPHEVQFLPASLALQETPVSPAPRVTMWLLMTFALIALLWSVFGRIDIVATAHGKIIPDDHSKVVQPLDSATVKAIHVADGQPVKAGDMLIELDATVTTADSERIANDLATACWQVARAEALLGAIKTGRPPVLVQPDGIATDRFAQEQQGLDGQYAEFRAKAEQIDAEIAKRDAELRSTSEMVHRLEQTAPIAKQRAEDMKTLAEKNFVARHGFLEREQERIEQESELLVQRSRVNEITAALNEARSQRVTLVAETRRATLDALNDAEQKVASYSQELIKADQRGRLMTLTAPVDGIVQQLAVHTVGGVVTPAQPLMVIVPTDHPLAIEAFVENKDIGFVNQGQNVEVKVETFSFTRYGTLEGKVTNISHDAINDEKRGPIYAARVQLERSTMQVENKLVNLTPGMAVTVEIKIGRRRVIEYFLSPLLQHARESLGER